MVKMPPSAETSSHYQPATLGAQAPKAGAGHVKTCSPTSEIRCVLTPSAELRWTKQPPFPFGGSLCLHRAPSSELLDSPRRSVDGSGNGTDLCGGGWPALQPQAQGDA